MAGTPTFLSRTPPSASLPRNSRIEPPARALMKTWRMLPRHLPSLLASPFALAVALSPARARADPLFDWGEDRLEDDFVDGDFDEEDAIASHLGGHIGSSDVHGTSWVSVAPFYKSLLSGRTDVGGLVVVGLALDRIGAGPVHKKIDPPRPAPAPPPTTAPPPAPAPPHPPLPSPPAPPPLPSPPPAPAKPLVLEAPSLAKDCVAAALRASGLGVDDERIESLIARSRASALLPETRMRAMLLWDDANHTTTLASTDTANFYDAVGANLVLELRLTWRLDRLVFAGDEPALERVRLERLAARSRLATRTLDVLFTWERARVEEERAESGSPDMIQAQVRAAEAQATLDVLTAGWFSEATRGGGSGTAAR